MGRIRGLNIENGKEVLMRLELYHRWECPFSARVRNFILSHRLDGQIKMIELDEFPEAISILKNATGKSQTPTLFIDGRPLLESSEIISWLQENLIERAGASDAR